MTHYTAGPLHHVSEAFLISPGVAGANSNIGLIKGSSPISISFDREMMNEDYQTASRTYIAFELSLNVTEAFISKIYCPAISLPVMENYLWKLYITVCE